MGATGPIDFTPVEDAMSHYIDAIVIPVPRANLDTYKRMSAEWGNAHLRHGALYYSDSISDDAQRGKVTSFPQAVQLKDGEVIALAWVVYRNKEERPHQQGGHGGSAAQGLDGPLQDALRWQAHVLGWLPDNYRACGRPVA